MSCNGCAKPYTLFRPEKGCPSCGFSYCGKCLKEKMYLEKLKKETWVCAKCKKAKNTQSDSQAIIPPAAYVKRIEKMNEDKENGQLKDNSEDKQLLERLKKLKEPVSSTAQVSDEEISKRLQKLKAEQPTASDAELRSKLAALKGLPESALESKPVLLAADLRTEEEQAHHLMQQYLKQVEIDKKYQDEFSSKVSDIETRLKNLKENPIETCSKTIEDTKEIPKSQDDESKLLQLLKEASSASRNKEKHSDQNSESEDEETAVLKIIEKIKNNPDLEDEVKPGLEELPFCEICNEDANVRCLGCKYIFCKQCFMEHKDDDDGCNKFEPYKPPTTR